MHTTGCDWAHAYTRVPCQLEAASCAEAIDALCTSHGRVDLVMLDVMMPGCDSMALGREILKQWPDQRIVYMSAHPAQILAQHGLIKLDVPFLAKPYSRPELLAQIQQALERRPRVPSEKTRQMQTR